MAHDPYAALRVRNFRALLASVFTMTVATQIQVVVVSWQIYQVTRDPLSLGLVGLAEAIPFVAVALYAGHVADKFSRRTIALLAFVVLLACSLALVAFTLRPGFISQGRVWPIYAVIFVSGIARSFYRPASVALGAELIARELYPNAVAWRTSLWQAAAVLGPALGGLLYGFTSATVAYAVDAALMIVAIVMLGSVVTTARTVPAETIPIFESLTSGIRFLWGRPIILGAMTLDLFSVLFGGAVALLPVFASDILGTGPQGLGVLRAAPAAGSVAMSLIIAHRPPFQRAGRTLLLSVALFGLCTIAFAISTNFYLSLLLLAVSGAADNISIVIRSTLLQTFTPEHLLGRVAAVNSVFIGSSNEIGAFESGLAARIMGTVPSVIFGGAMTLLVVTLTAATVPMLRKLRRIEDVAS
ncbi:MAG TPA: MFS transporter [Thermoanaerobaculia bacterium]|nr:MFS transporter [Thermoanaerobaculia bacterium]